MKIDCNCTTCTAYLAGFEHGRSVEAVDALTAEAQRLGMYERTDENQVPLTAELRNAFGQLEKLEWLEDEDVLLGTVRVLGAPCHVTLVKVERRDGVLEPTKDPHNRLEDILAGDYDGEPQTLELPGIEGQWVIGLDPFRD